MKIIRLTWIIVITVVTALSFTTCPDPNTVLTGTDGYFGWRQHGANITITDYTGPGGAMNIPERINGRPVKTMRSS